MGKEIKDSGKNLDASQFIEDGRSRNRPLMPYKPSGSESVDMSPPEQEKYENPSEELSAEKTSLPNKQKPKDFPRRKQNHLSYKEVFVRRNEIKQRQCVYISHEVHSLFSSLVRMLAESGAEVTVGGYIDKVLYEHLQCYKEEINEMYRNRKPDLLE